METSKPEPIKFTPKKPRTQWKPKDGWTKESHEKMSAGGKKGGSRSKPDVQAVRDGMMRRFLENNPLTEKNFYVRLVHFTEHIRHYTAEEIHVSLNGVDWFTVGDVRAKLEGR
jgi:hypothetical protein